FQATQGGGNPLPQRIAILNTGQGSMNWTASAQVLSGSGWLSVSPSSGTVQRPYLDFSPVDIKIKTAGLAPGDYFGQIQVNSTTANNGPQIIAVVLNVYPAGFQLGPELRPSGLVFIGSASNPPGSQNVMIANRGSANADFKAVDNVFGGNWLSHVPAGGTVQV